MPNLLVERSCEELLDLMIEVFLQGMTPNDKFWLGFWVLFFGAGAIAGAAKGLGGIVRVKIVKHYDKE